MSHDFYDFDTLTKGSAAIVDLIKELYVDNPSRLVLPPVQPGFLRNQLSETPPLKGCSIEQLVQDTKERIYPGIMLWQSPRFFGYFPSTIAVTNVLAEMFATTFHSPAFNYSLSPSHTELENITVDWSTLALGLPSKFLIENSGGCIINTSTTESVLVTIHAAKQRKMVQVNVQETPEKIVKLVGYYADFSFFGNQRGLKLKQIFHIRSVPVKYCQKIKNLILDTEKFEEMVQKDVDNGLIPFWYGGTYGTTFSGANDLNTQTLRICKKFGIWINVDAAYLGSSWICPQLRPDMTLLQQVDSIAINFSKTLLLGNGGSLLFIGDKKQLTQSMGSDLKFSILNNHYTGKPNVIDYKDWMLGLGRRNNSMKLYYLFRYYGLQRLQTYIRYTVERGLHLAKRIEASGIFKLFSKPELGLVCFQLCDAQGKQSSELTKKLADKIKNVQQGFMSPSTFHEYTILRFAIGNNSSTIEVIDKYFDRIEAEGKRVLQDSLKTETV